MNLKSRIDKHRQFTFHCFQTDKHSNRVTQRRRCAVIKEQQLLKKSSRKKTHNCETRKQCRRHRRRETLNFIFFVEKSWAGWKLCCERERLVYKQAHNGKFILVASLFSLQLKRTIGWYEKQPWLLLLTVWFIFCWCQPLLLLYLLKRHWLEIKFRYLWNFVWFAVK